MKRLALLCSSFAILSCDTSVDPCSGHGGTCLAVDVRGNVGLVTRVRIVLGGAQPVTVEPPLDKSPTVLPVAVGVELPDGTSGQFPVSAIALNDNEQPVWRW
jgi:hypothetical protein